MTLPFSEKYVLIRVITLNQDGDLYRLNCLYSIRTKNRFASHKIVSEKKNLCFVLMLSEGRKILPFNQYKKSDKTPSIHYTYLESIIRKVDGHQNNLENSLTTKVGEHIRCGYLMSTVWTFDGLENKHDVYSDED